MTKYKLKLNKNYLLSRINKDRTVKLIYDFTVDVCNESAFDRVDSEYSIIIQLKLAKKMYGPEWSSYIDLDKAYGCLFNFKDQYYSIAQMMFLLSEVQYRNTQKQCSITINDINDYSISFIGSMYDNNYIVIEADETFNKNNVYITDILNNLKCRGVLEEWES